MPAATPVPPALHRLWLELASLDLALRALEQGPFAWAARGSAAAEAPAEWLVAYA